MNKRIIALPARHAGGRTVGTGARETPATPLPAGTHVRGNLPSGEPPRPGNPPARRWRRESAPAATGTRVPPFTGYTRFCAAIGVVGRARSRQPSAGGILAMTAPRPAPMG